MLTQRTYSISEAADQLSVSVGYLRLGERLGSIPRARRAENGWRLYTSEDIERLRRLGVGERKRQLQEAR